MIIADGLRTFGPDPEKLRAYLATLKGYHGLARIYATDADQNMGDSVVLVKFDSNGGYQAVAKFPAGK
jgi:hypothetical protein